MVSSLKCIVPCGCQDNSQNRGKLPAPLLYQLLCEVEIEVPVSHAWLDHRSLKPFVEGGDGNPIGIAGDGCCPPFAVGRAVVARDDVRSVASRHSRLSIPRHYA